MAETPPPPSSGTSTPPSSAADQARIRKERREAKIRAGGSARLNKITGLGGGIQRDPPAQPTAAHADPDEVDISDHFYEPKTTSRSQPRLDNVFASPSPGQQGQGPSDDQLRQMMLGFDPTANPPPGANPFAGFPGMEGMGGFPGMGMPGMDGMGPGGGADDPMMKMLQQMMGSMGEGPGGMPTIPGMPGAPAATASDQYAYLWRIIHALFAVGLGIYIAFSTTFSGTKIERERSALGLTIPEHSMNLSPGSVKFFWIFATAELLLQSSRFFMEKGRLQQGGIMGMVMGFLPEPWKGYVALISRYSRIWTTLTGDAMVCVFVLGVCAWLRGS